MPEDIPAVFANACIILRLLYDVALDSFDKPTFCGTLKSPSLSRQSSAINEVCVFNLLTSKRSIGYAGYLILSSFVVVVISDPGRENCQKVPTVASSFCGLQLIDLSINLVFI